MRPPFAAYNEITFSPHSRSNPSRQLTAILLLAALLLVVTLIGPATYLLAKNASATLGHSQESTGQSAPPPERLDQEASKDGDAGSPSAPKRTKGILQLKNEANKVFTAMAASENFGLLIESADAGHAYTTVEAEPKGTLLPPQFLQRPPPAN